MTLPGREHGCATSVLCMIEQWSRHFACRAAAELLGAVRSLLCCMAMGGAGRTLG